MKGFLIAVGIFAALYFADQQFAAGKYSAAVGRMAVVAFQPVHVRQVVRAAPSLAPTAGTNHGVSA